MSSESGLLRLAEEYIVKYYKTNRSRIEFGEFCSVCACLQGWRLGADESDSLVSQDEIDKRVDSIPLQFNHGGWWNQHARDTIADSIRRISESGMGLDGAELVVSEIIRATILEFGAGQ